MSDTIHPNVVILAMEGYTANLNDVHFDNQEPLYSWDKHNINTSVMWKSSALRPYYFGFWVTELAIYMNGVLQHIIPGAHVVTHPSSKSHGTINYAWKNINQRYVFQPNDILCTQGDMRHFLKSIPKNSIIYFKGGNRESAVATLLQIPSINIEERDVKKISHEDVAHLQAPGFCKVHSDSLCQCPKAKIHQYLHQISQWYRPADFDTGECIKNNDAVKQEPVLDDESVLDFNNEPVFDVIDISMDSE